MSTRLVVRSIEPAGNRSVILPSVCPATSALIACRADSGAPVKSAVWSATPKWLVRPVVKAGSRARPRWVHSVSEVCRVTPAPGALSAPMVASAA